MRALFPRKKYSPRKEGRRKNNNSLQLSEVRLQGLQAKEGVIDGHALFAPSEFSLVRFLLRLMMTGCMLAPL
jgi:hypothetical protein